MNGVIMDESTATAERVVQRDRSLVARTEDHALTAVPASERRGGWAFRMNGVGLVTTLLQISIGGTVTLITGVGWGLVAGVVVVLFGGTLGWLVGHVAYVSGTSSTVTTRFYGLGVRGSAIASLIFAFMILGFLALENAILYYGTLFMLGWDATVGNAIAIYGAFTLAWILLAMFGMTIVQRTSVILLPAFLVLVFVVAGMAVASSDVSLGEALSRGPVVPGFDGGWQRFTAALSIMAGSVGALALVNADFARYARSTKDVGILAFAGAIMMDIVLVALGSVVLGAGGPLVAEYLGSRPEVAGSQGGVTIADKVAWMATNNAGAYFIVLAGILGFALMYAAQVKSQVINTYSGSLALSNLFDALLGRGAGRFAMVVIGNIIGLLMVAGNILGLIHSYLGALGITTTAVAGVIIADFFIVRRGRAASDGRVEAVNWAGVSSVTASVVIGLWLTSQGVTQLGFLVSLVLVLVLYPAMRLHVVREGVGTHFMSTHQTMEEAG